jgi:NAD(P)-dependent dehydrogenase (short-subunit alcohol dehydrogenase family)
MRPAGWIAAGAGTVAAVAAWRRWAESRYSFDGRVALITGGSRGLGLVMARELAAQGARLVLLARDAEELARAQKELTDHEAQTLVLRCDVRSQAEVNAAVAQAAHLLGGIDVLINNAGVVQVGPIEHMTLADFHDAMAVHFWGPLYATLAALPHMRRAGGGRIVNIASIGGKLGVPHLVPYCASKFALVGLSEGLRHELKRYRILVTTVCPGLMRTGGPIHALFKGRRESEYAWFTISSSVPGSSMKAERAAGQILRACRRGDAEVILTLPARLAVAAHGISPGAMSAAFDLMAAFLPGPAGPEGDQMTPGWENRQGTPSVLTRLSDEAAQRNNELTSLGGSPQEARR